MQPYQNTKENKGRNIVDPRFAELVSRPRAKSLAYYFYLASTRKSLLGVRDYAGSTANPLRGRLKSHVVWSI